MPALYAAPGIGASDLGVSCQAGPEADERPTQPLPNRRTPWAVTSPGAAYGEDLAFTVLGEQAQERWIDHAEEPKEI